LILLLAALGVLVGAAARSTMSVKTKNAAVRERPSFLGKRLGTVPLASRVEIVAQRGAWYQVVGPGGRPGWMHRNELTAKRVRLSAGDERVRTGATGDEVALATKGFDKVVEEEYKKKNPTVSFAWVDRMEQIVIPSERMGTFVEAGGLTFPEGGAE
jgi:hypothetical protein